MIAAMLSPDDASLPIPAADAEAERLRAAITEIEDVAALHLITGTTWWQKPPARGVIDMTPKGRLHLTQVRREVIAIYDRVDTTYRSADWALLTAAVELQGRQVAPLVDLLDAIGDNRAALDRLITAIRITTGMEVSA